MDSRNIYLIIIGCLVTTFFSCEEKELMVNANDVSYIIFGKDMMTDTTKLLLHFMMKVRMQKLIWKYRFTES